MIWKLKLVRIWCSNTSLLVVSLPKHFPLMFSPLLSKHYSLQTNWLKWKPDYDNAADKFTKAGNECIFLLQKSYGNSHNQVVWHFNVNWNQIKKTWELFVIHMVFGCIYGFNGKFREKLDLSKICSPLSLAGRHRWIFPGNCNKMP